LYQGQNRLYGFGSGFFESKIKSKFVAWVIKQVMVNSSVQKVIDLKPSFISSR
jgi:hypothetical protein